jgi:membrane-associated phospholipid phosphatase
MVETNVKNTAGDMWSVWTAPARGSAKDWAIAAAAIGSAALVSVFDDDVDRWAVRHRDDRMWSVLSPMRQGGAAFSGRTITPVAVGLFAVSLIAKNERMQEGIFGCVSGYAATSLVRTYAMYPLIGRQRPDSGRGIQPPPARQGDQYHFTLPGSTNWGMHSLPAGHFANVASCATFLTDRFSMGKFVEPAVYAIAAGVGLGRTLDRRHWLSDTVLSFAFAYATGRQVSIRSSERERRSRREEARLSRGEGLPR